MIFFPAYLIYEHQYRPRLNENIIRKPKLDHLVNVKLFLYKDSNEPNISQKLEYILAYEPVQKLSYLLVAEKPITKATPVNRQKCIVLLTKNPQL